MLDEIKARKTPGQDNTTVIIYRHIGTPAMSSPEPIGKHPLEAAPHQTEPNADVQTGERAKQTTAESRAGMSESADSETKSKRGFYAPVFRQVTMNPKLGTRVMKKASLLFTAWLFAANPVFAEAPAITGIVAVGTTAEAAPGRTGFVADDNGHIIARINAPNQTLSVSTVDGAQYSAHTVAYDKTSGLALLKVDEGADTLKPYIFAHHPAEPQRKVYGIKAQSARGAKLGCGRHFVRRATE